TWNSFADNGPIDAVLLTLLNGDIPISRLVLDATQTSYTFPANTMEVNQNYTAELSFIKVSQRNSATIPGSLGLAGFAKSTSIQISTSTGAPVSGLANISTRGEVGTVADVMIAGFIVTNTDTTSTIRIVARGLGPSLAKAGITGALMDPEITLFDANQHVIATDDDWANSPSANNVEAAGLAPGDARESAVYAELLPGAYTAVVFGKNSSTGIGLAEIYDLGTDGDA